MKQSQRQVFYQSLRLIGLLFIILMPGVLFLGCNNGNDCVVENVSYARFNFYDKSNASVKLSATITVTAAGTDSILVNKETSASGLELPVSYTAREDTFVIQYTDLMRDTIFMSHTNIPYFISMDCGMAMYHLVEKINCTHYAIDSIKLVNPQINFDPNENFKIYYSTLISQ